MARRMTAIQQREAKVARARKCSSTIISNPKRGSNAHRHYTLANRKIILTRISAARAFDSSWLTAWNVGKINEVIELCPGDATFLTADNHPESENRRSTFLLNA